MRASRFGKGSGATMTRIGMDVDVVESVGRKLMRQGQSVTSVVRAVDGLIEQAGASWWGGRGRQFVDQWRTVHRPALLKVSGAVDGLGHSALENAREQRVVSGTSAVGAGVFAAPGSPGGRGEQWWTPMSEWQTWGLTITERLLTEGSRFYGYLEIPADLSAWRARVEIELKDWRPLPSHDQAFSFWKGGAELVKSGGAFLDFAQEAFEQVHEDLANPDAVTTGNVAADTALYTSRGAIAGGITALGGLGGAAAGAAAGAMVGSVFPGPGTAVGAVVGGVIGGVGGTFVGEAAGSVVNDVVVAVGDGISEVGYGAYEAVSRWWGSR